MIVIKSATSRLAMLYTNNKHDKPVGELARARC